MGSTPRMSKDGAEPSTERTPFGCEGDLTRAADDASLSPNRTAGDLLNLLAVHFDQTVHLPAGASSIGAPLPPRTVGLPPECQQSSISQRYDETSAVGGRLPPTESTPPPIPASGEKGRIFGHYELLAEIARGGMGVVYKARHLQLNRIVALKMVRAERHADVEESRRLLQEARTAAHLSHPNLVAIHEAGEFEGRHFFAMDFVKGESLAESIRRRLRSPQWSAECMAKIARAIHHAHLHGVLHRDLKPSNILLDEQEEPHVTDFGVAKRLDLDSVQSTVGQVIGTPSYMPPEQAAGRKEWVGPASDVYSMGAILYELLTGRPPFQAVNAMELFLLVRQTDPLPPALLNPRVPRDLQTICLKCLEKDPRRRYASAGALREDLDRFLQGEPILARPTGPLERTWKWSRKHPSAAALVVTILLGAVGLHASQWYFHAELNDSHRRLQIALEDAQRQRQVAERRKLTAEEQQAEAQRLRDAAETQRLLAEQRELTARRYLYAMHLGQIQQAWQASDTARVVELLEHQLPVAGRPDLRGFEWFYYWKMVHADQATLTGHQLPVAATAYSPGGKWLASASEDGSIILWDGRAHTRTATFHAPSAVQSLAFLGDGRALAAGCEDGRILMWNVAKASPLGELCRFPAAVGCLAPAPDGKRLAAGCADGVLRLFDLEKRVPAGERQGHAARIRAVAFSADGKFLASGDDVGAVLLWDDRQVGRPTPLVGHDEAVTGLAFAQQGNVLYSAGMDGCLRVWDATQGTSRLTVKVGRGGLTALALGPNEQFLALGTGRRTLSLLDTTSWREIRELRGHTDVIRSIGFSADPQILATAGQDGTVKIWDVRRPEPEWTFRRSEGEVRCLAFSPRGDLLASGWGFGLGADTQGEVWIRERRTGRTVVRLPAEYGVVQALAFSPDGKRLAAACRGAANGEGQILLWSVGDWEPRLVPQDGSAFANRLTFSPDSRHLLAACSDGAVRRWELQSCTALPSWTGHSDEIVDLTFSPGGKTLATAGLDGTVRLWDATEGLCLQIFGGYLAYSPVAFAPDGRSLATAVSDPLGLGQRARRARNEPVVLLPCPTIGQIALLDLQTKQERFILKGHAQSVQRVVFSPDGARIVTAGRDGHLRLWDAVTGHPLAELAAHQGIIHDVAFSPDGEVLVTAGSDGLVRVYQTAEDIRVPTTEPDGPSAAGIRLPRPEIELAPPLPEDDLPFLSGG